MFKTKKLSQLSDGGTHVSLLSAGTAQWPEMKARGRQIGIGISIIIIIIIEINIIIIIVKQIIII